MFRVCFECMEGEKRAIFFSFSFAFALRSRQHLDVDVDEYMCFYFTFVIEDGKVLVRAKWSRCWPSFSAVSSPYRLFYSFLFFLLGDEMTMGTGL